MLMPAGSKDKRHARRGRGQAGKGVQVGRQGRWGQGRVAVGSGGRQVCMVGW